ncbi:MAG: AAA family ATPase [Nisaea sp.]|uniref:AAA family ATPase n=1 Tax=Nisaea sp. TaxID=2024842 RepID=UPI001B244FF1|nr:AAA family ATPase [Nisaea sp.]MBO6560255.1 AAA family ATPase [Nisaea sp.]
MAVRIANICDWAFMSTSTTEKERRARTFLRRSRAAKEKRHLPTFDELLIGMPFFGEDIGSDVEEFAERLLVRVEKEVAKDPQLGELRNELLPLTMVPSQSHFRSAAAKLREIREIGRADLNDFALRCDLYAACHGCVDSGLRIAAAAVDLAERSVADIEDKEAVALVQIALGWLRTSDIPARTIGKRREATATLGEGLLHWIIRASRSKDNQDSPGLRNDQDAEGTKTKSPISKPTAPKQAPDNSLTAVVFTSIGNRETSEGRRVAQSFNKLVGKPLPLVPCPNLADVRTELVAEYPYAETVITTLLEEVALRPHVALRPTILDGDPGIGKTRFARRVLTLLGIEPHLYSCGGVADASLAGTSRRWTTGEPSLPVAQILQHDCASPGIILDEIEKAGTSRHNGNVFDALLGFFEFQSASNWHDPYIEGPVDLSHVIWIGTANSIEELPSPLRDRCRIIRYPAPDRSHLPLLASQVLKDLTAERGLDSRWARPLSGEELEVIARAWEGGSIRNLRRFVEGVLNVRERLQPRH